MEQQVKPERAQRSRVKGYKMVHPNGLPNYYVGRPGQFGNMFKIENNIIYIDATHRRQISDQEWKSIGYGTPQMVQDLFRAVVEDDFREIFIDLFHVQIDIKYWVKKWGALKVSELKGQNLYCYCPICNEDGTRFPCHADVLLELANK